MKLPTLPPALAEYVDSKSRARLLQGVILGFALVGVFGFGWFGVPNIGFTTSGTATQVAEQRFTEGRMSILAIPCAVAVSKRPDFAAMKAAFADAKTPWDFSSAFEGDEAKKLITPKGETWPDRDLAKACGMAVLAAPQKSASK